MTQIKNPTKKNYDTNQQNENETSENKSSQEVELPLPEKKNETITTNSGKSSEDIHEKAGRMFNDDTDNENDNEKNQQTGFDVNNSGDQKKEKRGNEKENLERDNTREAETQEAEWQKDKINEANNLPEDKQNYKDTEKGNDKRKDSILDKPKTETYSNEEDESYGDKIRKDNYTHAQHEEKRDDANRKNREKTTK